ncbi:hypothetical protein D3C85_1874060 [compost metagenome]
MVVMVVADPTCGSTFTYSYCSWIFGRVPNTSSKYWVGRKSSSRMRMGSLSSTHFSHNRKWLA